MADKQPELTGAYYGPAIPPAEPPRRHRGRSCFCCLFGVFWKILLALVVLLIITGVVLWLVVQPRMFKFYVDQAQITQFDYNNTLRYNMVLNFTARNPNKKLNIYYDYVEAHAYFEGTRFATSNVITHLNSFRQYKKSTSPMTGVFSGQQLLFLEYNQVSKLNEDKNLGAYDIYVRLYFRIRFRLGDFIFGSRKPKAKCGLRIPLNNATTRSTSFLPTKCDVHF